MAYTYEDKAQVIDEQLEKHRHKWFLHARKDIDYDDIKQIIRIHIWKKWNNWNQEKSIEPWLHIIVTNQIKNILRNYYSSLIKPCVRCDAAIGDTGCQIHGEQCSDCPLFKKWEKTKKSAHDISMPISIDKHVGELEVFNDVDIDYEEKLKLVHKLAKESLNRKEYKVYDLLYIQNKSEEFAAKELNYKPTTKNQKFKRYKQLENYKKSIIAKVSLVVKEKLSFVEQTTFPSKK